MNIVVVGSINMDNVLGVHHIPVEGETIIAKSLEFSHGGKGANQAVALARLGSNVSMIGAVGNDANGDELTNSLKTEGVNTDFIFRKDVPTGCAFINLDKNAKNNIIVYPGANFALSIADIHSASKAFENASICILQQEIQLEVIYEVLKICKEKNIISILNPAPANPDFDPDMYKLVSYLLPNETELELIANSMKAQFDVEYSSDQVLKLGCENIIVTLGDKGSYFRNNSNSQYQSAIKVKAVDTTAAGDSFIGGFSYSLSEGKSVDESMKFATAVSALTVTKKGAINSLPTKKEVEEFIKQL